MIKNLRKAFTIIELVIVIAVIAVLAAVLIPTFSSLVDKANESVDMQLVKQMNTILEAEEITNDKPSTVIETKKVLEDNGISQFKPIDSNNVFYWVSTKNIVLLYNNVKNKVVYPKEYTKEEKLETVWFDLNFSDEEVDVKPVITPSEGQSITEALIEAISEGDAAKDVYLNLPENNEIDLGGENFSNFFSSMSNNSQGKKVHIDLNGSSLNFKNMSEQGKIMDNGVLELSNGYITYEGKSYIDDNYCLFKVENGASLVLDNINLSAKNCKAVLFPAATASEIVISNTNISANATFTLSTNGVSSSKVRIQIDDSKIEGTGTCILVNVPSVTYISNSTLIGCEHALAVRSGEVTISNSVLKTTRSTPDSYSYKDFASGTSYCGGYWHEGNIFPAATMVAGDYSKSNSYKGNVNITLNNTQIFSTNVDEIPTILMATPSSDKKIMLNYDENSIVGDIVVYGTNWSPAHKETYSNEEVTIISYSNALYVNGKQATLTEDKKTKIED